MSSALVASSKMSMGGFLRNARAIETRCFCPRTTLVVAHRLSTVKSADEIIVITSEGIKERGTHDELMKLNGIYRGLHEHKLSEDTAQ